MSITKCAVAVEQATGQCDESIQELSCCCTVAQAARNGHCEEIKQLINSGK